MAEAALSTVIEAAFDGLRSLIQEGFGLIRDFRKDVENLRSTLSRILAVIADAEKKQLKDKALKNWLAKLKHVAYDIDDILDEYTTKERELEMQQQAAKKARTILPVSVSNLPFRLHMGRKIKDVNERLDAIAAERSKFHLIEGAEMFETEGRQKTDSFIIESDVVGRNEDKDCLIEKLLDVGKEGEVSVIPIVGMGGLGKTTLAQLIYNDTRLKAHFNLRIWVCVSDDFDVRRLLKAILDSGTDSRCDSEDVDKLQRCLQENLKGRKFLLVLDDVWDENPSNWERLKGFLRAGARDSKIIVTTRSEVVAGIMGTVPPHHLGRLSDDDCWALFKQRAFGPGQEENPNLIVLGKEIVKKCGGVPLAAKALGSLMRFKTEELQWESIKENEFWNLPEERNEILPALRLSYYQLPPQLKQCFAYCSIFPKDHSINTEHLILFWMAEGFIQRTQARERIEDIGRECFNNLLWRSFFQEPSIDDDGNIVRCKMHDLMHDLAVSVSGDACSIVKDGDMSSVSNGCRHLSMVSSSTRVPPTDLTASNRTEKLRTLLMLAGAINMPSFDFSIHFPLLRVLDISCLGIKEEMLNSLSQLKQLRYLHLSLYSRVSRLPEAFSELHNLQTLSLSDSLSLEELPRDMRRMNSLRHLEFTPNLNLTHMPAKMGELKFLQTLPVFIVGEDSGRNIRELQDLKLGGELQLRKLEHVRSEENAGEAKLKDKENLRSLTFSWSNANIRGCSVQTLEGLRPHPNLKFLTVENYGGERFPNWMGSITNLNKASLLNCSGCEQLPSFGKLPSLKSLRITSMCALKRIDSLFYGDRAFPSLVDLTFKDMPNLEEWSEANHPQALSGPVKLTLDGCPKLSAIPCFPRIKELKVSGCPELTAIPCFPRIEELKVSGCPKLTVIPCFPGLKEFLVGGCSELSAIPSCPSLEKLGVTGCPKLTAIPCLPALSSLVIEDFEAEHLPANFFQNRTHLSELIIQSCRKLASLPRELGNLASLQQLVISDCSNLALLELPGRFTSLQSLDINCCRHLVSIVGEMHHLSSLETLVIEGCSELGSLPEGMEHLISLKSLSIRFCGKVRCLPDGLKHAQMLQRLYIIGLPSFEALPEWIGNLSSLQSLDICDCRNLVSLPSGLQNLTSLKSLYIVNCPQLEKRCERMTGEDWHKLAHIPDIQIKRM